MARSPRTPSDSSSESSGSPEVQGGSDVFEQEESTPILATGTRDDLTEKARTAIRLTPTSLAGPRRFDDDVASLAHDLKNPLTIIMLETSQIEQRLGIRTTPAVLRGLERIAQNASYIDRLVSDLLDLTQHDAGKLELRLDTLDLSRLLQDAVGRAVPTAERGRVQLDIRDLLWVNADETRIERVVSNLVCNALKYSMGHVTVRLDRRGVYACVSVIDSGPGLTSEESRRIFDRYRRASTAQQGYGLGLHTSRRIIEAHRGRIGIASQPGRGSRFFFELPLVDPPRPGG